MSRSARIAGPSPFYKGMSLKRRERRELMVEG